MAAWRAATFHYHVRDLAGYALTRSPRRPTRTAMSRLITFIACSALAALIGCNDPAVKYPSEAPATTQTSEAEMPRLPSLKPEEPTPAIPGFAVGRVFGFDGKPITLADARIEIIAGGILDDGSNMRVNTPILVGRDGSYMERLKPGAYMQPTGRIEFTFKNRQYRLPLTPRPPEAKRQDSAAGLAQDFIWKLEGPRPGDKGDRNRPETWIGGTINPIYQTYRDDLKRPVKSPPPGSKVVFTLLPKSPLADGSEGKPRTATRHYNPTTTGLTDAPIVDVPLAYWEVRGEEILPDGSKSSLLFTVDGRSWQESVAGSFQADLNESALKPVEIYFTRKDQ